MVKHPSVCLSHRLTAAVATGRFAAEHPASRRYQSIAGAGAQQQWCRRPSLQPRCLQLGTQQQTFSIMFTADIRG